MISLCWSPLWQLRRNASGQPESTKNFEKLIDVRRLV